MPQVPQPPGQGETVGESMFGGRQGGNIFFSETTKQHIFGGMRKIEDRICDIYIYIYIYICICTLYLKKLLL